MKILKSANIEVPEKRLPENPYGIGDEQANWIWNLNNIYKKTARLSDRLTRLMLNVFYRRIPRFGKYFTAVGEITLSAEIKIVHAYLKINKLGQIAALFTYEDGEFATSVYSSSVSKLQAAKLWLILDELKADIREFNGVAE